MKMDWNYNKKETKAANEELPPPTPINQQLTKREDPRGNGKSELSAQLQI